MKHSEDIYAILQEKNVSSELLILEDADHGFRGKDMERAMAALVSWFQKQLLK